MSEIQEIRFRGILTDMDGLLADSEALGIRVAVEVCRELGLGELSEEEQRSFIGITDEEFYRRLFKARGQEDLNVVSALERHFQIYERSLAEVPPFPDEVNFLKRAYSLGIPIALVSGSTRYQIEIILNALGLSEAIPGESRVACEDYEHGKPSPEGYVKGAQSLDLEPQRCVVLEDATSGIRAGKAAGAFVIAVARELPQDTSAADILVPSLAEWVISREGEGFVMRCT